MIGLLYRLIVGTFTSCNHQWIEHKEGCPNTLRCIHCGTLKNLSCNHQWVLIQEGEIARVKTSQLVGKMYILRCKHCGDITQRQTTV